MLFRGESQFLQALEITPAMKPDDLRPMANDLPLLPGLVRCSVSTCTASAGKTKIFKKERTYDFERYLNSYCHDSIFQTSISDPLFLTRINRMSGAKKTSPKALTPSIINDAFAEAVKTKFNQGIVTKPTENSVSVSAFVTGTAKDTVQTVIVDAAKNILCRSGFEFSCQQASSAPGKAELHFHYSTEKGKERVAVGITMDTNRALFYVKKMASEMHKRR